MSETTANVTTSELNDKSKENSVNVNSDSNSPNGDTPNSEAKTEPNLSPGNIDNSFYLVLREKLTTEVNSHNQLAAEIKNAGDRVALKDQLKENPQETNDEEFVAIVSRMNELSDALAAVEREFDAKSEPYIQNALKRSGVEAKQSQADELAKTVKATINFLTAMDASIDGIPTLTGRSANKSTGDGRGSGVAKYRNLNVYVDGKRAEQKGTIKVDDPNNPGKKIDKNVMKSNLTYGAQAANVPGDVFREAFITAQGTKDAAQFKDRVEFEIVDGKDNTKTHSVVVVKDASE